MLDRKHERADSMKLRTTRPGTAFRTAVSHVRVPFKIRFVRVCKNEFYSIRRDGFIILVSRQRLIGRSAAVVVQK